MDRDDEERTQRMIDEQIVRALANKKVIDHKYIYEYKGYVQFKYCLCNLKNFKSFLFDRKKRKMKK